MPKLKKTTRAKTPKKSALMVMNDLVLRIHLGWSKKEREKRRPIVLSIAIRFPTPPKACTTDQLGDTVCYHELTKLLQKRMEGQSFRLVEYLACAIYNEVKGVVPKQSAVSVRVTKFPHIKGLTGGVCFHYGEEL